MEKVKGLLAQITGKKNIYLTRRGNESIKESLKFAKARGYNKIHIQDQGGWMTYSQFIEKLKLNLNYIKTDYGLVKGKFKDCALLINTMPAYAYLQEVEDIETENCIVINDISGSIGHPQSKWGDIVIGSFGKHKPVDLEKGGFIASNYDLEIEEETFTKEEIKKLTKKLERIYKRIRQFAILSSRIKKELKHLNVIHPGKEGINVIIQTKDEKKKQEVRDYCNKHRIDYTECPRYIRINEEGISIEVKRIKNE